MGNDFRVTQGNVVRHFIYSRKDCLDVTASRSGVFNLVILRDTLKQFYQYLAVSRDA